jgi:hypothetical protein
MTGLFMLAFSFALNTDTQKPHTHVFTSHMVVIVHHSMRAALREPARPALVTTASNADAASHGAPQGNETPIYNFTTTNHQSQAVTFWTIMIVQCPRGCCGQAPFS